MTKPFASTKTELSHPGGSATRSATTPAIRGPRVHLATLRSPRTRPQLQPTGPGSRPCSATIRQLLSCGSATAPTAGLGTHRFRLLTMSRPRVVRSSCYWPITRSGTIRYTVSGTCRIRVRSCAGLILTEVSRTALPSSGGRKSLAQRQPQSSEACWCCRGT